MENRQAGEKKTAGKTNTLQTTFSWERCLIFQFTREKEILGNNKYKMTFI